MNSTQELLRDWIAAEQEYSREVERHFGPYWPQPGRRPSGSATIDKGSSQRIARLRSALAAAQQAYDETVR